MHKSPSSPWQDFALWRTLSGRFKEPSRRPPKPIADAQHLEDQTQALQALMARLAVRVFLAQGGKGR
jgi:hypothetical protein